MASTALAILSLAAAKEELRVATDETDHDALITAQIAGAASYVSRWTRAPLVDRAETHRVHSPGSDSPIALLTDYVQSISPIRYHAAGTALREAPDGTIAVADLGRREQVGKWFCVWPPADGWPELETGSMLELDLTRGIQITAQTQSLRDAVVVVLRHLYGAEPRLLPKATILALIDPWRRMDADPPGSLVTVLEGGAGGVVGGGGETARNVEIASYTFPYQFALGNRMFSTTWPVSLLESGGLYVVRARDTEDGGLRTDVSAVLSRAMFDSLGGTEPAIVQVAADTPGRLVDAYGADYNFFRLGSYMIFGLSNDADPVILFASTQDRSGPFALNLYRVVG